MWIVEKTHEYLIKPVLYSKHDNEQDAIDIAFALNTQSQPEDPIYVVRKVGKKVARKS